MSDQSTASSTAVSVVPQQPSNKKTKTKARKAFGIGEAFRQIIAGTIGGMTCTVVGYPFDTFKVRMQMGVPFRDVLRTITPRTLFAGIAAPIAGAMPVWAAGYSGYNLGKHLVPSGSRGVADEENGSHAVTPVELLAGGVVSGTFVALVRCPTDFIKINCQNQGIGVSRMCDSVPL